VAATCACLLSAGATDAAWHIESVDPSRLSSGGDLALDAADQPHISFGGDALYLASFDGTVWTIETIDDSGCVFGYSSLALDGSDRPAVSYQVDGVLKVARREASGWVIDVLATDRHEYRARSSIAFDDLGLPIVAFSGDNSLCFARWDGVDWNIETVDPGPNVALDVSLALDAVGLPAVSYYSDAGVADPALRVARFDGAVWSIETIDSGPGRGVVGAFNSLAFDSLGFPAVSYYVGTVNLYLARFDGTSWNIGRVDGGGGHNSLAFDNSGFPVISYEDRLDALRVASWTGASWDIVDADTGDVGLSTSLAFATTGDAAIAHYDRTNDRVKLTRWDTVTGWTSEVVNDSAATSGYDPSLALDASGAPAVSYTFGERNRELRFAQWHGTDWAVETIATGGDVGISSSLTFDAAGQPLVSYVDLSTRPATLAVARFDGVAWVTEVVDPDLGFGSYSTAIAVDPAGNPAIAYSAESVKLARWDGSSWVTEDVHTKFNLYMVAGLAIAFDPAGRPAVSYHQPVLDWDDGITWLGRFNGSSWDVELLAYAQWRFGNDTSLAFDADGHPAVAMSGPRLARFDGATWTISVVDPAVDARTVSLAFNQDGEPLLAYDSGPLGPTGSTLEQRFARANGATWDIEVVEEGEMGSLALSPAGDVFIAFHSHCSEELRVATELRPGNLHRGRVPSLAPGWRSAALPLTSSNDDETGGFPLAVTMPDVASDVAVPAEPLVLYRVLGAGDLATGNRLTLVRRADEVELQF